MPQGPPHLNGGAAAGQSGLAGGGQAVLHRPVSLLPRRQGPACRPQPLHGALQHLHTQARTS